MYLVPSVSRWKFRQENFVLKFNRIQRGATKKPWDVKNFFLLYNSLRFCLLRPFFFIALCIFLFFRIFFTQWSCVVCINQSPYHLSLDVTIPYRVYFFLSHYFSVVFICSFTSYFCRFSFSLAVCSFWWTLKEKSLDLVRLSIHFLTFLQFFFFLISLLLHFIIILAVLLYCSFVFFFLEKIF